MLKKVNVKDIEGAEHTPEGGTRLIGDELFGRLVETLRYYDNMAGEKFRAPTLANATNMFIIDELGEVRGEIKPRQTYEKLLSTFLKDKIGIPVEHAGFGELDKTQKHTFKGEVYEGTFSWVSKYITDGAKLKEYTDDPETFIQRLGRQVEYSDFMKLSEYWEFRTKFRSTED